MDESVYALIPERYVPPAKEKMHRSKHNHSTPPTYSTFPSKVSSLGRDGTGGVLFARAAASIGADVAADVNPKKFLKAGAGHPPLPTVTKFDRHESPLKQSVPSRDDKPVMGLKTEKNFVMSNAVEAIVTAPKRATVEQPLAMTRPSFGKTPSYLHGIKQQLQMETTAIAAAGDREKHQQEEIKAHYFRQMAEEDKDRLLAQLKEKWEEKHRQYQALPFAQDTAMQIARKEGLENEMKAIEQALAKLNKKVLYVYKDSPDVGGGSWLRTEAMKEAQGKAQQLQGPLVTKK